MKIRQTLAKKLIDAAVAIDLPTVQLAAVPGVTRELYEDTNGPDFRAVDLELYEYPPLPADWRIGVIKPNRIRINGVECVTPDGAPFVIEGLLDKKKSLTATMTLFVRSLKVHAEAVE
jgi:hypothetical protein